MTNEQFIHWLKGFIAAKKGLPIDASDQALITRNMPSTSFGGGGGGGGGYGGGVIKCTTTEGVKYYGGIPT